MKNLITDFTVFVNEKYSFLSLTEADKNSISGLEKKVSVIGATRTPTTDSDALKTIKGAFEKLASTVNSKILTIDGDIKDGNSLYISSGNTSKIKPRTEKNKKDYIKIGGKYFLDGSGGKLIKKSIIYKDLFKGEIEAAGNGIYVIGRVIAARFKKPEEGGIGVDQEVNIYMNLKSPISVSLDVKTGVQYRGGLGKELIMLMISSKCIIPLDGNTEDITVAGKGHIEDKDFLKTLISRNANPNLGLPVEEVEKEIAKLEKVGDLAGLDATEKIKPYANKRLQKTEGLKEAAEIMQKLLDEFKEPYFKTVAERLKTYINGRCKESGIGTEPFNEMFKTIDEWAEKRISDVKLSGTEYHDYIKGKSGSLASVMTTKQTSGKGSPGEQGARSKMVINKGKEGEI